MVHNLTLFKDRCLWTLTDTWWWVENFLYLLDAKGLLFARFIRLNDHRVIFPSNLLKWIVLIIYNGSWHWIRLISLLPELIILHVNLLYHLSRLPFFRSHHCLFQSLLQSCILIQLLDLLILVHSDEVQELPTWWVNLHVWVSFQDYFTL